MQKPTVESIEKLVADTVADIVKKGHVPPSLELLVRTSAEAGVWRGLNLAQEIGAAYQAAGGTTVQFQDN